MLTYEGRQKVMELGAEVCRIFGLDPNQVSELTLMFVAGEPLKVDAVLRPVMPPGQPGLKELMRKAIEQHVPVEVNVSQPGTYSSWAFGNTPPAKIPASWVDKGAPADDDLPPLPPYDPPDDDDDNGPIILAAGPVDDDDDDYGGVP